MFFPSFTSNELLPLPPRLVFTIEHQASQVIVDAEPSFIKRAMEKHTLPEDLFWEVEFFGSIPYEERERILGYFRSNNESLYSAASQLLDDPDDPKVRHAILQPVKPLHDLG